MWAMIAEPGLRCAECGHTIQPGRLYLSELPKEAPGGINRARGAADRRGGSSSPRRAASLTKYKMLCYE